MHSFFCFGLPCVLSPFFLYRLQNSVCILSFVLGFPAFFPPSSSIVCRLTSCFFTFVVSLRYPFLSSLLALGSYAFLLGCDCNSSAFLGRSNCFSHLRRHSFAVLN